MKDGQICNNCNYGMRIVDGQNKLLYIECRHSPPSVSVYPDPQKSFMLNIQTYFPRLKDTDWCCQWKEIS